MCGPIDCVAADWARRVQAARAVVPATQLYAGRGFVEARVAASVLQAPLFLISAGLGLINSQQVVPSYSLTLARKDPDSVARKVSGDFSAAGWWRALHHALGVGDRPLMRALSGSAGLVVAALPSTYLGFITTELLEMPAHVLSRIRLIGPPRAAVPQELSGCWMPYDTRFDGNGGPLQGTRGDFAQRAARHFAEEIAFRMPDADAATHAEMVEKSLRGLSPPSIPSRLPGSDEELIAVIRQFLPISGGRSGETLRLLRREAGRACEQGRFRRLFAIATHGR
jgi:hypothetical protein